MTVPTGLLSWLAHEIATPLNSIRILAELLAANRSGALGEKELRYAASLQTAAGELNRVLDDIAMLGRLEEGRLMPRPAPVVAEQWVAGLRAAYLPSARAANVDLQFEVAADVSSLLHLDVSLGERLLGPIVSRAVAVSARGKVRVSLDSAPDGGVRVAVADSGPPLAPGEEEGLFAPFRRRDPSVKRVSQEVGLGLMIARELARRLGGALVAENTPPGVTLSVSLPASP